MRADKIYLRALELDDIEFLFEIENNRDFWEISYTILPFSKYYLEKYIKESNHDIFSEKQFRFVISIENKYKTRPTISKFSMNKLLINIEFRK